MTNSALVITSIANDSHPVLNQYAVEASQHQISFIVIGDTKSPVEFNLEGCHFYSIKHQQSLSFELAKKLPTAHYARKNLGYLIAIQDGVDVIIETDDDNLPMPSFWHNRTRVQSARLLHNKGWVNVYKYFTEKHIWPRGFALEKILESPPPTPSELTQIQCPIQQGLTDDNPDVDAIYRLTSTLPIVFEQTDSVAIGAGTICPFNSQNTTWFKEAFPLLYLPSYCSFRMTDIWRSYIAQRIAWTCEWPILFHKSTVRQERNEHNLMSDFHDELIGYKSNLEIFRVLGELNLNDGIDNIPDNMIKCYQELVDLGFFSLEEIKLLHAWLNDISIKQKSIKNEDV